VRDDVFAAYRVRHSTTATTGQSPPSHPIFSQFLEPSTPKNHEIDTPSANSQLGLEAGRILPDDKEGFTGRSTQLRIDPDSRVFVQPSAGLLLVSIP
jgi:hypothetical protein